MPARKSFEQSQLASQIGVGYGEAQVLTDRAALIEQQAARKEREGARAAEAAKKAEAEKRAALKIDFPKDLAPAMQSALAREATKMYQELRPYYGTEGFDQKKQEMISEFTGKIAQAKEYTRQFKSGVDTYATDRGTKNYNPDTDTDINLVMDSNIGDASWDDVSGWMDKANTDLSTSYTTKGYAGLAKEIMPIVNFSADKNTVMFPGKDGKTYKRTTEEFSEDDAKNLIRQTISTSDNAKDWFQSGLAEMSDADKKTYGEDLNGVADYYADRFASDFTRDNIKTTYEEPKKDDDKGGWSDRSKFNFSYTTGSRKPGVKGGLYTPRDAVDSNFEEIRMERTDIAENKPIFVTNPDDPQKEKIKVIPISVRREKGKKDWNILYKKETQKTDSEGNFVYEKDNQGKNILEKPVYIVTEEEKPFSIMEADIKANYGGFDPNDYLESIGGSKFDSQESEGTIDLNTINYQGQKAYVVKDKKEYDKLPSGSLYLNKNTNQYARKK